MQCAMRVFGYEDKTGFRVIDRDGGPWFSLTDGRERLGISSPSDTDGRLDGDEKDNIGITDAIGRNRKIVIINESGLYSLILTSRKPEAKRFKKWITSEVLPSIRRTGSYSGNIPAFIKRHNENFHRLDHGHFSVISELAIRLWGRLEMVGHIMADRAPDGKQLRPDGSVGGLFARWLDEFHPSVCSDYKMYRHKTDEWEGDARQYPRALLPLFIEFVDDVWIPQHSERYFNTRDPAALPFLPLLLPNAAIPARIERVI